jgi:hypothetical protein
MACVPLVPMATLPKLRLDALELRSVEAGTAVPLTVTVPGVVDTLLITDTALDNAPVAFGEKTILKFAWLPAGMVMGKDAPVIVIPAAVVLT